MDKTNNIQEIQSLENQILELEKLPNNESQLAEKHLALGKAYLEEGEAEKTKNHLEFVINGSEANLKGSAFHQLGNLFFRLDNLKSAKQHYQEAVNYYTNNEQYDELGNVYNLWASVYTQEKDFKTALPYFEKSIEINAKHLNFKELGKTFHNLRVLVSEGMSFKNQKVYYETLLEKENFKAAEAFITHNLGLWHYQEQEYEISQKYFEVSRQAKENQQVTYELGSDYYHLGSIFEMQGKKNEALDYHLMALEKMLAQKEYDFVGVTIYFLQHSQNEIKDEGKKAQIEKILQEAENQGIILQTSDEINLNPSEQTEEESEKIDFSKALSEVIKQESGKSLEETYQILKAGLPDTAEQYAETAFDLVEKLQSNYQKAWFSKKSKKQAFEEKKAEVLEVLNQYPALNDWKTQIEKFI